MKALVVSALSFAAPAALAAPVAADVPLLEHRLAFSIADRPGPLLLRSTEGHRPYVIAYSDGGISLIVAGAILGTIATPFLGFGGYFLLRSINATGDAQTTYTALGWSLGGVGAVLTAIGLPLLLVGIFRIARWGYAAMETGPLWFASWGCNASSRSCT